MLFYSTNPAVTTVCSLRDKVERIAVKVMSSSTFSAARTELFRNHCYSVSAFKADVEDMVSRELHMKGDRAERLKSLHKAVVNHIMRNYC